MTRDDSRLAHPLLGTDPRLSAIGLGYLVVVVVLVVASVWRQALFLSGGRLPVAVDGLSWLVIFLATVSTVVVAILYGLVNGGPGLAAVIALAPHLAVAATSGQVAGDVDIALALAGAGVGGSVALLREMLRRGGGSLSLYPGIVDGAVVSTVPTLLALVVLVRLAGFAGPHASTGLQVAAVYSALAVASLLAVWWRIASTIRKNGFD